jgi:hypothetical protein
MDILLTDSLFIWLQVHGKSLDFPNLFAKKNAEKGRSKTTTWTDARLTTRFDVS